MPPIKQSYTFSDYQLDKRDPAYEGFFALEKFHFRHKRFDGSWSRSVQREVFVRGAATCVLPFDAKRQQVLLTEQFRVGALLESGAPSPWLLEIVAGINDKNESPETIARREAQEEAGIDLGELIKITSYFPSPGACTEWVYLLCGQADLSEASGIHGLYEEDEDIKVHVLDLDDAYALVQSGVICNAAAIITLQWLMLNRERVTALWDK